MNKRKESASTEPTESKEQIVKELIKLGEKHHYVARFVNKYRFHQKLSVVFSENEVKSELYLEAVKTANAWESWAKLPANKKKTMKLGFYTIGDCWGYFRMSFFNAMTDMFAAQKLQKRNKPTIFFSEIAASNPNQDLDENDIISSIQSSKNEEVAHEIKDLHRRVIKVLREVSRKRKKKYGKDYGKIAHLYVILINPKYQFNMRLIREKLRVEPSVMRNLNEDLNSILKFSLKGECEELWSILGARSVGAIKNTELEAEQREFRRLRYNAPQDVMQYQYDDTCRVSTFFRQEFKNSKPDVYSYNVIVQRIGAKNEIEIIYSRRKVIKASEVKDMKAAKELLEKKSLNLLKKAEDIVRERRGQNEKYSKYFIRRGSDTPRDSGNSSDAA